MPISVTPYIPQTITVHTGPANQWAENVTVSFPDYIKNVASSEIYPTWPEEALRANILAQISFALNRIYTEYYPSRGYDFDITASTMNDQKFIKGRSTFENVDRLVDELFTTYIRRKGFVEPLAAKFCNGTTVTCDGLSQWGSQELAQEGANSMEILRHYYGDNIELVVDAPIQDLTDSYPGTPLRLGAVGRDVVIVQAMLNRISQNYPAIPKISPATGVFGEDTRSAVTTFQRIFNLTPDGIVGKATWYKLVYIHSGILQLAELVSQGQTFVTVQYQFPGPLEEGDSGPEVGILQYMLALLAQFDNSLSPIATDGEFGPATTQAVRTYQQLVGLTPDGYVDETTWNSIYSNFALADYFLRRDTVRAQSLGEDAVPVMAEGRPDAGAERWGDTPRMGQYRGRPLELGQMDGQNGQRGVKV